ncbi:MAG: MFS transporter [Candidatus Limnocylindrales bacterium]
MRTDRSGQLLVAAGGLGAFVMLGWTGLLVPSLIRDIERDLLVTDADLGTAFLLNAITFTAGCLLAGWAVAKVGRRPVLIGGVATVGVGLIGMLAGSWPAFLASTALRGLGSGIIEVGVQGLFLYAFVGPMQGRAVNLLHFCYGLGAALAPIAIAGTIGAGIPWPALAAASAVPWLIAGGILLVAPMDARPRAGALPPARLRPSLTLVAAAVAIGLYVASEVGVSSWLVRFLAEADLGLAAGALTLFWAALAVSRLLVARFGVAWPPETLAIGGFMLAAAATVVAVAAPTIELSIAMFTVVGFAFGPIYAGIILLGGRIPGRKDAVTSILATAGVAGSTVYPPLMGIISVGPGLGVAMAGTAVLSVAGAVLVVVAARSFGRLDPGTSTMAPPRRPTPADAGIRGGPPA